MHQHAKHLDGAAGRGILDLLGGDGGYRHQPAALFDAGQRRLATLAPHQIQHQIDQTVGHHLGGPVRIVVIHHLAGPQRVQEAVVVTARRRHHLGAIGAGKLHRQMADAAGTGQDQHPLPP